MKKLVPIGIAGAARVAGGVEYRREIEQWREQREAELKAEDGWLTVTGLFWLKPGERYAIRLKDNQSRLRKKFAGLGW